MEEWRAVSGYEGYYEISSFGRVRGVERIVDCGCRGRRKLPQRVLSPTLAAGYLAVELNRDGQRFKALVHRLVCMAWHGPQPGSEYQVGHNDGSKINNTPENLRWLTAAENAADRKKHGREKRGTEHHCAKLNPDKVKEIRRRAAKGESTLSLGRAFGCSGVNIQNILHRRIWQHV